MEAGGIDHFEKKAFISSMVKGRTNPFTNKSLYVRNGLWPDNPFCNKSLYMNNRYSDRLHLFVKESLYVRNGLWPVKTDIWYLRYKKTFAIFLKWLLISQFSHKDFILEMVN